MYSKQLLITARMLVLLHALRRKEKALTGPSHLWACSATEQPLNGRNAHWHSPRPLVRAVLTSHIATPCVSSHSSFPTALPLGCSSRCWKGLRDDPAAAPHRAGLGVKGRHLHSSLFHENLLAPLCLAPRHRFYLAFHT